MKVLTDNKYYSEIANVIREQNGTNNTYKPPQMVNALKNLFYEEVEGVPPISFNGIGENLLDYRIDGASGGVGDKTSNLFDGTFLHRSVMGETVGPDDVNRRAIAIDISNYNNGEKITFSRDTGVGNMFQMYQISSIQTGGRLNNENVINGDSNTLLATKTITNVNEYPYLMIFLNGATKPIEDEELIASKIMINVGNTALPYEPYGYKVPVVVSGKNLLRNTAATQTINGVTFTVNDDGSVTCNGTANETVRHMLGGIALMSGVQYKMSGCPTNGANNTYRLDPRLTTGSVVVSFIDNGNGAVYTPNADVRINVYIYIQNGYTCDNLTFYPMIRLTTIEDDTYEPYIEPTITNIYLDEPILENESISMSHTNVSIPTIRGTNVLTVDTTVQPSNVYVKARKESQYETIMRERYEEAQAQLEALESGGE